MSDDWSLKGKSKFWDDQCTEVFAEITIETLRKKLIEDIGEEFRSYQSPSSYQLMLIAKSIINKRFGVEE